MTSSSLPHRDFDTGPGLEGPNPADVLDPELLALPAPPRTRRLLSLALLSSVVVASAALLVHLRADAAYSFASERAIDVGEATRVPLAGLVPNRYVRVRGTPMLSRMVRYERGPSGEAYALFPLSGQRQIFVQVPASALRDPARVAQGAFSGRLMTFGQLGGRLRPVRLYLAREMSLPVTAESFVLLAEETPSTYSWALALCAVCGGIMLLAFGLMLRWFRPLAR